MQFKIIRSSFFSLVALCLLSSCESLKTENNNNPSSAFVITTPDDLFETLSRGYASWWQGIHSEVPVIGLGVASDTYGFSREDFAAKRMGEEPRSLYNNLTTEEDVYTNISAIPWTGCLSAVTDANDVLAALDRGVTIDQGGAQDQSIRAAAYFLRGVSWGYLGLMFDQTIIVEETTDLETTLPLMPYVEVIPKAALELDKAANAAQVAGIDFIHEFFSGVTLGSVEFSKLCHSYAARFLVQWPRTNFEYGSVDWAAVKVHAEQGIDFNFGPEADGALWQSYHKYVFADTGLGPIWARVDQRIIAAMDPNQPARYPEVEGKGEEPLAETQAQSDDKRLELDFFYVPINIFDPADGEWHFSHYLHNRNISDPGFAGDGANAGPMPVFLAADNDLLLAEALLNLNQPTEAITVINAGSRTIRGELTPIAGGATPEVIRAAIFYERNIELLSTAPMGLWFDRRRASKREAFDDVSPLGGLQLNTPAHLPVPAKELLILNMPLYGFGGITDSEGIFQVPL